MNKSSPNGKFVWPMEMKLFLVNRIREHITVLAENSCVEAKIKDRVWLGIMKALQRRGVRETSVRNVKKMWATLRSSASRKPLRSRDSWSDESILLYEAVNNVIELSQKIISKETQAIPMPIVIKKETPDEESECEANDTNDTEVVEETIEPVEFHQMEQKHEQHEFQPAQVKQLNATPVVLLDKLPLTPQNGQRKFALRDLASLQTQQKQLTSEQLIPDKTHNLSPEMKTIYDRVADVELKIKLIQHQREQEQLEFEREVYSRKLTLLELDIKRKNLEIERTMTTHIGSNNSQNNIGESMVE